MFDFLYDIQKGEGVNSMAKEVIIYGKVG